jgi:urease accessory protein
LIGKAWSMRAISVKAALTWSGTTADRVVLDYDDRHRRRAAMTGTKGLAFLLDLPATAWLRGGDALVLEDGRLIEVVAAPEPLLEIRCANAKHLARVAWHLGNRHLPTQVLGNALRIRRDHVMADMAVQLGARVAEIEAPFDPEGGAYAGLEHDHRDGEDHGHDPETHSHDHGQDHGG